MKCGWGVLMVLAAALLPGAAKAQAVYAEFSDSAMTNLNTTNYLPGATIGILLDGPQFHKILLSVDIQGRFLASSNQKVDGVAVGPRFTYTTKRGWAPYGEVLYGFARYWDNGAPSTYDFAGSTTDSQIQFNAGVAKRIAPHFDAVVDFSYSQLYAYAGEYNPKTASAGLIYHFAKR